MAPRPACVAGELVAGAAVPSLDQSGFIIAAASSVAHSHMRGHPNRVNITWCRCMRSESRRTVVTIRVCCTPQSACSANKACWLAIVVLCGWVNSLASSRRGLARRWGTLRLARWWPLRLARWCTLRLARWWPLRLARWCTLRLASRWFLRLAWFGCITTQTTQAHATTTAPIHSR